MPPLFTHPLVVTFWSLAIAVAMIYGWSSVTNYYNFRHSRDRISGIYAIFTLAAMAEAVSILFSLIPMAATAKVSVFHLMWIASALHIYYWSRAIQSYCGLKSRLIKFPQSIFWIIAATALVDLFLYPLTGYSLLFEQKPVGARSIVLQATGDVYTHKISANLFGLGAVLCTLMISVILFLAIRKDHRTEWLLMAGVAITGAAAILNTMLGASNSEYSVPLLFLTNIIEAVRITWVRSRELGEELQALRKTQSEDHAFIRNQLEQLKLEERLIQLGQYSSRIGHDARNPLATAIGGMELLENELRGQHPPLSKNAQEFISIVRTGLNHVLALVQQITGYATNTSAGESESVEIKQVVQDSVKLTGLTDNIRVLVDIDDGSIVLGNRVELVQVFVNILGNAQRAVAGRPNAAVTIRCQQSGKLVKAEVINTGPKPEAAVLQKMFRTGFTTAAGRGGHGLGLLICKDIVHKHSGQIYVNKTHEHMCIAIELPAAGQQAKSA